MAEFSFLSACLHVLFSYDVHIYCFSWQIDPRVYFKRGSNQNVESETKNVESKTEKCGVQNSIFTSRNQLF